MTFYTEIQSEQTEVYMDQAYERVCDEHRARGEEVPQLLGLIFLDCKHYIATESGNGTPMQLFCISQSDLTNGGKAQRLEIDAWDLKDHISFSLTGENGEIDFSGRVQKNTPPEEALIIEPGY